MVSFRVPNFHDLIKRLENLTNLISNARMCLIFSCTQTFNRKNDLILIMTSEKQDKPLELSKHWSADSTLARNKVIMKKTYPVKSVKCDKICSDSLALFSVILPFFCA